MNTSLLRHADSGLGLAKELPPQGWIGPWRRHQLPWAEEVQRDASVDHRSGVKAVLNDAHDDLPGNRPDLRQAARDRRDAVSDILADLDQQDLTTNTAAFAAQKCRVDAANEQVRTLQADIKKITDCMATATQVADALDKACTAADKLFCLDTNRPRLKVRGLPVSL